MLWAVDTAADRAAVRNVRARALRLLYVPVSSFFPSEGAYYDVHNIIPWYEYAVLYSSYSIFDFPFFESKKGFSTPTVCFLQDVIRGLPAPGDLNVKRRNG